MLLYLKQSDGEKLIGKSPLDGNGAYSIAYQPARRRVAALSELGLAALN